MSNFLAIDQGTTSSRAIIFSSNHELITDSQEEYSLSYPNDGWVEAEPNEILRTVKAVTGKSFKRNLRNNNLLWNNKPKGNYCCLVCIETGEPIYPAIVWQDRRTHELCKSLKENGYEEMVRSKTGLVIDPYFSATKIKVDIR